MTESLQGLNLTIFDYQIKPEKKDILGIPSINMNRKNGIHAKPLFQPKGGFTLTFEMSNFQDGKNKKK